MADKGGKRAGAGRKPSTIKGIARKLPRESAELILAEIKANHKWVELAQSDDERIVLDTLKYLTDRAHGKASQAVEMKHSSDEDSPMKMRVEIVHIGSK
jgi:hypothetical protein